MPQWPHAPAHVLTEGGSYIVTGATYRKQPTFASSARLTLLCEALLETCAKYGWDLQAWAVFPNHYHFIATSPRAENLPRVIRTLHAQTARAVNKLDHQPGRVVWFQYWDTRIRDQRGYLARLHYVHENAVSHGLVKRAANYPWCSAGWFERSASPAFRRTVLNFPCTRVVIPDSFAVTPEQAV